MKKRIIKSALYLIILFISSSCFAQDSLNTHRKIDTVLMERMDFMDYQVTTLNQIISLQSNSINNLNLMIQLMYTELQETKLKLENLKTSKEIEENKKGAAKFKRKGNKQETSKTKI